MATLLETLGAAGKRPAVIQDCVRVVDEEVGGKGGLTGLAIKATYKVVKGLKPGVVGELVDYLLDDFSRNLQPLVDEARAKSVGLEAHLTAERSRAADALLAITDGRARGAKNPVLKGAYEKLRPMAKRHVEEAIPRVASLLERYLG